MRDDPTGLTPLPADVPVTMPAMPELLEITTLEQMKALSDPVRTRITQMLQFEPATAKQIAGQLGLAPGTVGHHLHTLERAGLVRVVALRQVRGTVARYYARVARLYGFSPATPQLATAPIQLEMLDQGRAELAEVLAAGEPDLCATWGPHVRLSAAQIDRFATRITALVNDLLAEPEEPGSQVVSLYIAFFQAPPSLQARPATLEP